MILSFQACFRRRCNFSQTVKFKLKFLISYWESEIEKEKRDERRAKMISTGANNKKSKENNIESLVGLESDKKKWQRDEDLDN